MKWTWKRHTYERRGRQMHSFRTQFLILVSGGVLGKLHPIIWSCISLWMFPYKLPQFGKRLYLEHLCTMASISSVKKDSIAPTRDSFKNCILACETSDQMHTNFQKRKISQAASGNFVQKWLFCKTYVLYNICFFICGQKSCKTRSK